jgi:hypothetical protein
MADTPLNDHPPDSVDDAITLSVLDAVEQLIQERAALEQFAEEKYARLTQLREELRAQGVAATSERDAALAQVVSLTEELKRAKLSEQLATDELAQLRQQHEQQRRQTVELQRLLDVLREEVAREEREQAGELSRTTQLERENAELKEILQDFEQAEAELRQEQEALRKERERLGVSAPNGPSAVAPPTGPSIIVVGDQRFIAFACKHCSGKLQAKEHLAGLVMRCTKCSKMAPVPRP